jgi:hypothetical protein
MISSLFAQLFFALAVNVHSWEEIALELSVNVYFYVTQVGLCCRFHATAKQLIASMLMEFMFL